LAEKGVFLFWRYSVNDFVTITVSLSPESFDYLYQYSKRYGLNIESALDSLILFDETQIKDTKSIDDVSDSDRNRCRLFISEMLKLGDEKATKVIEKCVYAGFSRRQAQRSMADVSSRYVVDKQSYRKLAVNVEEVRSSCEAEVPCSICGKLSKSNSKKLGMCEFCQHEYRRVLAQNSRTRKLGLLCDLSVSEWIKILDEHNRSCVYCGGQFTDMDHVIPVSSGGGTTKSNVVPSCSRCNTDKNAPR